MKTIVLVTLLFGLLAYPAYHLSDRVSRFYAREFCSCYFVLNKSAKYCEQEQAAKVPIMSYTIDEEQKIISATFFLTRTSIHTSERFGCQLQYHY